MTLVIWFASPFSPSNCEPVTHKPTHHCVLRRFFFYFVVVVVVVVVLLCFFLTCHKPWNITEKVPPSCQPIASLWGGVFLTDVDSATPRLVILGAVRKQGEQTMEPIPGRCIPLWLCCRSCPAWIPPFREVLWPGNVRCNKPFPSHVAFSHDLYHRKAIL